jgi:putative ABC transport system substrate-binding protein
MPEAPGTIPQDGPSYSPEAGAVSFGAEVGLMPRFIAFVVDISGAALARYDLAATEKEAAAQALGVQLQVVEARGPADFERAFLEMSAKGAGALFVLNTALYDTEPQRIVDLAAKHQLPAMHATKHYVELGGLMCYGPNLPDFYRRSARYADKILKGAKPSDLPIEQPTKYEFFINRKTANALGLTLPPMLLARADEVIE